MPHDVSWTGEDARAGQAVENGEVRSGSRAGTRELHPSSPAAAPRST